MAIWGGGVAVRRERHPPARPPLGAPPSPQIASLRLAMTGRIVFARSLRRGNLGRWGGRRDTIGGRMERHYYVYILTNAADRVFYVGVTNDLGRRVYEHKTKAVAGFSSRYNVNKLVYYEDYESLSLRGDFSSEKQIKAGSRADKVGLVSGMNPSWNDLYDSL